MDLLQNKLFLVGSTANPIPEGMQKREIFQELPLIFREEGSGTRQAMELFFEQNQISVAKKLELTSNEAVKQAVLAGLGYSIMPMIGIKNEIYNKELQIIPVEGLPISTKWRLIWLKGKKMSPVSQAFYQFLSKEKDTIAAEKFKWYERYP
jgi:DNA-binding transcriptional LysR family regulator